MLVLFSIFTFAEVPNAAAWRSYIQECYQVYSLTWAFHLGALKKKKTFVQKKENFQKRFCSNLLNNIFQRTIFFSQNRFLLKFVKQFIKTEKKIFFFVLQDFICLI